MRIVCQQTILMQYHASFVIFEKNGKNWNCRLLQIVGSALWAKYTQWPWEGSEISLQKIDKNMVCNNYLF